MLLITDQRESLRALEEAYVDYLAAYTSFRAYVQTQSTNVRNVTRPEDPGRITPVVEGSEDYWRKVHVAAARMDILGQGDNIPPASQAVRNAFWEVLENRAGRGPGEVPDALVKVASQAEARFAKAARADLDERNKEIYRSTSGPLSVLATNLHLRQSRKANQGRV
jgi:hypothetical protein